jgi:hypothetical protein
MLSNLQFAFRIIFEFRQDNWIDRMISPPAALEASAFVENYGGASGARRERSRSAAVSQNCRRKEAFFCHL